MNKNKSIFLNGLIDLAQSRLGSKIVYKTDEFFAPAKRIINPWPPIFKEGVFDKHGKWMDGWETRRKRGKGHDYLILKLGKPGKIHKVDIDTSYFSGNQPSKISLEACFSKKNLPRKNSKWVTILKKKSTKSNSHHYFNIKNKSIDWATKIVEDLDYIGTLCVEFFIDKNNNLYANEIAPRVHNSGHLTINTHNISQFENHIRAVCGLEKVETKKIHNGKMLNLIGSEISNFRNKSFKDNEFFYDYLKTEIRDKRKMGHLTIIEK